MVVSIFFGGESDFSFEIIYSSVLMAVTCGQVDKSSTMSCRLLS